MRCVSAREYMLVFRSSAVPALSIHRAHYPNPGAINRGCRCEVTVRPLVVSLTVVVLIATWSCLATPAIARPSPAPATVSVASMSVETGSSWLVAGLEAYVKRDFAAAVRIFETWKDTEPKNPDAYMWLAKALAYDIERRHNSGRSWLSLGGPARRVAKIQDEALKLAPNHFGCLLGRAIRLRAVPLAFGGSKKEARRIYESLLRREPDNPLVMLSFSILLEDVGEIDEAIQMLHKSLSIVAAEEQDTNDPELHMKLSECYFHLGRMLWEHQRNVGAARSYLECCAREWDYTPGADVLLAEIARSQNEETTAIDWYVRALRKAEAYGDKRREKAALRGLKDLKFKPDRPGFRGQ